jgi:hypothetical protein
LADNCGSAHWASSRVEAQPANIAANEVMARVDLNNAGRFAAMVKLRKEQAPPA